MSVYTQSEFLSAQASLSLLDANGKGFKHYSGTTTSILRRIGSKLEVYRGFTTVSPFTWWLMDFKSIISTIFLKKLQICVMVSMPVARLRHDHIRIRYTYWLRVPSAATRLEEGEMSAERGGQADCVRVGLDFLVRYCLLHSDLRNVSAKFLGLSQCHREIVGSYRVICRLDR